MKRFLICFLFSVIALWSQEPRGTIVGKVTDSSGAVVPGATVRATNTATNVTLSSTSNEQGQYEIPYLLPGVYTVDAESSGFKKWTRGGIELRTGDRVQVDIQLEVGNITQTVEVTASAPVLETTTGSIAQVMTSDEATNLPQRGGSLAWIYSLAPGIVLPSLPNGGPWNISQGSNFSVAGSGSRGFDFNVDGVTNNSYGGRTAFTPPADMVQEVRIQTASYDASIGHTRGGSVSISLKSGTNKFHGSWVFPPPGGAW